MLFHNCYLVVEFTSLMVKARNCMNHQLAFCKYFSLIHIRSLLMTVKKSAQALKTTQNTITVLLKTQERKETIKKIIKQYYCGTLVMIPSCSKPIQPLEATCAFNLSVPLVKGDAAWNCHENDLVSMFPCIVLHKVLTKQMNEV